MMMLLLPSVSATVHVDVNLRRGFFVAGRS